MRKLLLALLALALPLAAAGQATFLTITINFGIVDASGTQMPQGTFCAYATDATDSPIAFLIGSQNQAVKSTVCRNIVGGTLATTLQLANPAATVPVNIRYHVTITNTLTHVVTQYPAVSIVVATGVTTWDWSQWNPSLSQPSIPQNLVVGPTGPTGATGAPGATGPTGPPVTFLGAWSSSITYPVGVGVSSSGNSYVALLGSTNVAPPSSCTSSATWALMACGSTSGTWGLIGGALTSQADLQAALAFKTPIGGTGNGQGLVRSLNPTFSTNAAGHDASGIVYIPFGNSTVANDVALGSVFQGLSMYDGQPLHGMKFYDIAGPYSCDASGNVTLTMPNADAAGNVTLVAGDVFGLLGNAAAAATGGFPLGIIWGGGFYSTVLSSSTTSVTFAGVASQPCVSISGTITTNGASWITPNAVKMGFGGTTLFNDSGPSGVLNTLVVPLLQAEVAQGRQPIFMLREGLINDVRQDQTNFAKAIGLEQLTLNTVHTAAGLSGVPLMIVGEESLNSSTLGGTFTCAMGTPVGGGCDANSPPTTTTGVISTGVNTVTLNDPTGFTICPPSIWPGPGMPFSISSQGNTMQLVLDTVGSGVQETVTVTAVSATVTDSSHYTCAITFTAAHTHGPGAQFVATRQWATQVFTDELEAVIQTVKTWVNQYPSLTVLDTQESFYGRFSASAGVPKWQADNLHLVTALPEDVAIAHMINPSSSTPASVAPTAPIFQFRYAAAANPPYQPNELAMLANPIAVDPYYSEYAADNSRFANGYWNPWVPSVTSVAGGTPNDAYALSCAGLTYFDMVFAGFTDGAYTAGATTLNLTAQVSNSANSGIRGGGGSQSDIIYVAGLGCFSGQISSSANTPNSNLTQLTLTSPTLPSLPVSTQVFLMRYKTFDQTGLPYLRNPGAYPYHVQAKLTGGGTSTYDLSTLQPASLPGNSPGLSVTAGYTLSFATSPVTVMAIDPANVGNGLAVNGDTVTFTCNTTNATGVLSVQNGYPYFVVISGIGGGCHGATNVSQAVTDTTTPAATGIKIFIQTGSVTLAATAGTVGSTQIGTGSPASYANGDTITQSCTTTNATWTAQAVSGGVPAYLKQVSAGVGCTAATNGATTTSGSGTGLTVTTAVSTATTCAHTSSNNFVACSDTTGTPYALYNNLALDIYATSWPDTTANVSMARTLRLVNPTVANLGTNVQGASGGSADVNVILGGSVFTASLTTTAATSDNVTITGMVSTGHCSVDPTNTAAVTATQAGVTTKTANQVTVTHAATSGMTYDVICTTY